MATWNERKPYKATGTVSIDAGGSGTATITITDKIVFIKSITVTKDADVSVSNIKIDNIDTSQTATFDSETTFGTLLTGKVNITADGTNAGAGAENLTIVVVGYYIDLS